MNSSNRLSLCILLGFVAGALFAAPSAKSAATVPVARGFPVWQGVTDENYVAGRRLCPSDLRDKVVVVVEFEAKDAEKQLKAALGLATRLRVDGIASYYDFKMPTDLIVVCSNRGAQDNEKIMAAIKRNDAAAGIKVCGTPVYNGIVLQDGPDAGGKYPFFYILGYKGGEPLLKGEVNPKSVAEAGKVIKEATKDLPEWNPFVGRSADTKTGAKVLKAVASGKPLVPLYKALLALVKSNDATVAGEAQMAYDALERTRSDLCHVINGESTKSPACAYRDYEQVMKYWPSEKTRLADALKKMSAFKEGATLGRYCSLLTKASSGELSAAEKKKLSGELKKMKADLERMKEASNVRVQDDAHTLSRLLESVEGVAK